MQQEQTNNTDQTINDLTVAETEQAQIKGGPKKIFIGGLSAKETAAVLPDLEPSGDVKGGPDFSILLGSSSNHNETTASDDDAETETEALDDLSVREDQEEELKGGYPGHVIIGYGYPNHNETTASDDDAEAEAEALDDLPIREDQEEELKGGYPGTVIIGYGGGGYPNHNETVVTDETADQEAATNAPLADLTVSDEQAEQAKGGPTKRVWDYIRGPY